ncbi:hypothetical protein JTB14_036438 [Gonioctena quinquepunctata]|nr:hypothetical protein JTB14_036438 [Gonioctena quinquepunctata]
MEIPFNRLNSYQQLQRVIHQFWNPWSRNYLYTLQQRFRWKLAQSNITTEALVLLKEDNVPPMKWLLGRVVGVHPGSDGIVRVVSVRCKGGVVKSAISKVCPLPCEQ